MAEYDARIRKIFLNKPEFIINFPDWMFSKDQINILRNTEGLAIVEMAGRDSVAAAIKGVEEGGFTDLLPTYVYTGTEHGSWESASRAVDHLKVRLNGKTNIHQLLVLGSPLFWQALNGRYISELIKRFGFYTPCIGCHLYLHSSRIPLSVLLGNKPVITGERENHDGSVKINQIPEALDSYESLSNRFEVPLHMPIKTINDGRKIEEIIGIDWKQDKDQLHCVLSGNYRNIDGKNIIKKSDTLDFLNSFALPCAEKIIESYLHGIVPDHIEIARGIMDISL